MNNDLISRSALIAALENEKIRIAVDKVKMFGLIEVAPAVDAVEVKHGFNAKQKACGDDAFECSMCGYEDWDCMTCEPKHHSYCPNCGAKMDLEEN